MVRWALWVVRWVFLFAVAAVVVVMGVMVVMVAWHYRSDVTPNTIASAPSTEAREGAARGRQRVRPRGDRVSALKRVRIGPPGRRLASRHLNPFHPNCCRRGWPAWRGCLVSHPGASTPVFIAHLGPSDLQRR